MQLNDRSGISCDLCAIQYKTDFLYYSFDFILVDHPTSLELILSSDIVFSIDVCTNCFDTIKKSVIKNYKIKMQKGNKVNVCELTGEVMKQPEEYYYCVVSQVNVKISGQPNVCVKCKSKTFDNDKVCIKCEGKDFIKPALISADRRYVDIIISNKAYNNLRKQMESTRQAAGQWSTKS